MSPLILANSTAFSTTLALSHTPSRLSPDMADSLIGLTFTFDTPPQSARDRDQAPRGGLGSQVLPVAQLDDDFDGEPGDGSEYLFLVRHASSLSTPSRARRGPGGG